MKRFFSFSALASCVLAGLTLMPAANAQTTTRRYTTAFEVPVKRANSVQAPYQVVGQLAMDIAADGSFSCEINPLKDIKDVPDPPSVILVDGKFDPDAPSKLSCTGQVSGRLIGITIDMGNGYKIFGTGVMPYDLTKQAPGAITESFGGTVSTSVPGESGDWYTTCIIIHVKIGNIIIDAQLCR